MYMKRDLPIAVLLVINICVGVVIVTVTLLSSRRGSSHSVMQDRKGRLDQIYNAAVTALPVPDKQPESPGKSRPSLEFLSLLKPVAHLGGLDFDQEVKDHKNNGPTIRNCAHSDGAVRKLLYNGMQYESGSFIVPAHGLYRVYSHVKFYVEDNKDDDSDSSVFQHRVVRYDAALQREEDVFRNHITECKDGINDGAHLEYPSDVSGVIALNAGDSVFVEVSNFTKLKQDRDWHYFGMYMI